MTTAASSVACIQESAAVDGNRALAPENADEAGAILTPNTRRCGTKVVNGKSMTDATMYSQEMPSSLNDACRKLEMADEEIQRLRNALVEVRQKAIIAGAAFVRRNSDGAERCAEVLNIIDDALR